MLQLKRRKSPSTSITAASGLAPGLPLVPLPKRKMFLKVLRSSSTGFPLHLQAENIDLFTNTGLVTDVPYSLVCLRIFIQRRPYATSTFCWELYCLCDSIDATPSHHGHINSTFSLWKRVSSRMKLVVLVGTLLLVSPKGLRGVMGHERFSLWYFGSGP